MSDPSTHAPSVAERALARPRVPTDYLEYKRAVLARYPKLTIGEETFTIMPIEMLSDDDAKQLQTIQANFDAGNEDVGDAMTMARLLLDRYDRFVELGGSAMGLLSWMQDYDAQEAEGDEDVTEGEGGASSGS